MSTTSPAALSGSSYVLGHEDAEVNTDDFVSLFREEALAVNAVITMPPMITAWARVQR
jgi:hypothetical protein